MAKLTYQERKRLHKSSFAIPERDAYPIEDESHAIRALGRVATNGTPGEKERVRLAVALHYPHLSHIASYVHPMQVQDRTRNKTVTIYVVRILQYGKWVDYKVYQTPRAANTKCLRINRLNKPDSRGRLSGSYRKSELRQQQAQTGGVNTVVAFQFYE